MSVPISPQTSVLKYVATINDENLNEDTDADFELRYIDIGDVSSAGTINEPAVYRFADAPSRARRRVRDGDVIISCVRTYLQAVAAIENPPDNLVVSTGFAVVRPLAGVLDPAFCKYLLREPGFLAEVAKRSAGVSYPAINASDLGTIPVRLPPASTQSKVAAYLDRETARLDALVRAKERMLNLLTEKRRALITRTVTHGVRSPVQLHDSGIAWLGKIPSHWQVKRLKNVGEAIIGLTFDPADIVTDGRGVLVLRASNVRDQRIVLEDRLSVLMDIPERLRTREGDVLICSRSGSRALIGKNALIDQRSAGMTFGAFMTVFRSILNPYLFYIFNSPLFEYQAGAFSTSTINQLTVETLNSMEVPIPPQAEQDSIVAFLNEKTRELDRLRAATEKTIALLTERRAALIGAAVTGSLEVG